MGYVLKIKDKDDLDKQIEDAASEKLVVVYFYATWCGPCKMIAPKVEEFALQMMADVVFFKVDVEENEEIASEYKIDNLPTFIFLKMGERVVEKVGEFSGCNSEDFKQYIDNLLTLL